MRRPISNDPDPIERSIAPAVSSIVEAIASMVDARAEGATVCPSEVARALAGDGGPWRKLMPAVRAAAAAMAKQGRLTVTRGGQEVDALSPGGPIRLGRPRG